jgi:HK97 family phage portal protein
MPSLLARTTAALKAFRMEFAALGGPAAGGYVQGDARSGSYVLYGDYPAPIPNSTYSFRTDIGDIWRNSSVMACVGWVQRNFTEAPLQVMRRSPDGDADPIDGHPLTELINHPNPFYSGDVLWQGTALSYLVAGNAYWLTNVNGAGEIVELWYVPHRMLRPVWPSDGSQFLAGYLYRVNGKEIPVPRERVIHFRFGFDLHNQRVGYAPLLAGLPEVDTLNEGAIYTASVLRNKGVVGGILSNLDPDVTMTEEKADKIRARYRQLVTGDERGGLLVPTFKSQYQEVGSSPESMALDKILTMPQETVCALLGLNSMVVGLPSSVRTYSNLQEARRAAVENCVKPTKGLLAADLDHQLLPAFSGPRKQEYVGWDWSQVSALQEEVKAKWERGLSALEGGALTQDECRALLGYDALTPQQKTEIEAYLQMRAKAKGGGGFGAPPETPPGAALPESGGDRGRLNGAGRANAREAVAGAANGAGGR